MSAKAETIRTCDARKVAEGSMFTRHSSGVVTRIQGGRIHLRNAQGAEWSIDAEILEKEFSFADQHETEEKVTRTELITLLEANPRTAMTICWHKKVEPKDVAKQLAPGQAALSDRMWASKVREQLEGEERVMVGYHANDKTEHGRLLFHESRVGVRQVDPRTLRWAVLNRVRYVVK